MVTVQTALSLLTASVMVSGTAPMDEMKKIVQVLVRIIIYTRCTLAVYLLCAYMWQSIRNFIAKKTFSIKQNLKKLAVLVLLVEKDPLILQKCITLNNIQCLQPGE